MIKFAIKVLLFFTPLLILLAVTEYNALSMTHDFALRRKILENNLDRAEIVVTGSSHAEYAVKPKLLGHPAVSVAHSAQDLYYDTKILTKYLPQMTRVKLVVVTVSYHSFEYMIEDSIYAWQTDFYNKFWGIPRQNSSFKLADHSAIALFGIQQSRNFLLTGTSNLSELDDSGGNEFLLTFSERNVLNGQFALKDSNSKMDIEHIPNNREYLDELFSKLKAANIQSVIVTTPCAPSYYNNMDNERYLRMQNETKSLMQKYNLEYYNYLKDERFVVEDYFDSSHLNTQGAEKFSRILKEEVIEKYLP